MKRLVRRYHAPLETLARRLIWALWIGLVAVGCSGEASLPGDPLRISSDGLRNPVLGKPYREPIVAVGGIRPYQLRLEDGSLPPGLSLQGGLLLGTPTRLGEYRFVIAVSDGSLASTFRRFQLTVVDVAVPKITVSVPETEVRESVTLRARVQNADRLRAVRLRLTWDDASVTPADMTVQASRRDLAVIWEADENALAVDVAFLGAPFGGDTELIRIELDIEAPTRLGFDMRTEALYAGRHLFASERIGRQQGETVDEDEPDGNEPDRDEPPEPDEGSTS